MLIRFRVSNFRSLRDEQELSLTAASRESRNDLIEVPELGTDLVRVAAIYGANAAGKSNILSAARFMRHAVLSSHRAWEPEGPIPREPFLLDPGMSQTPSFFEMDFLLGPTRYTYGFQLDDEKIRKEWLHTFPNKRRQVLYNRDSAAAENFVFNKNLRGNNRTIESLTRPNSLFLSAAAENNHPTLSAIYTWFSENLRFTSRENEDNRLLFTMRMTQEDLNKVQLLSLLRNADLGIVDLSTREVILDDRARELAKAMAKLVTDDDDRLTALNKMKSIPQLDLHHQSKAGSSKFPIDKESRGTQVWLSLSGPVLHVINNGTIIFIDELDASLHPHLAIEIIRLFQDPTRNSKGAQLVFNTHDTTLLGNLLGEPSLHRDQVWFVEKDEEGATHLYPLTDFKPRKYENLERGYLQGRYGAIPFIEPIPVTEDA